MELSHRERISQLVEELTTSGQSQLHQENMKDLKKLCKVSNECIEHVYHSLMSQLNQEHAQIRLSAFQISSELFARSHHFRTLLVDNFQEFLELTVETDSDLPLPPPKEVARKLRALSIQTVQSWQTSFGSSYKKLALGYHFLKQVKKVDFQDVEARTVAERRREEERRRKMETIYRDRVEAASKDMEEIEVTLTEMESCMKLLFPDFSLENIQTGNGSSLDDGQPCCSKDLRDGEEQGNKHGRRKERKKEEEEEEEESTDDNLFIRHSGLVSHTYSLDLKLSPDLHVTETEDNEAVVSTVIDLHKLITTKHLPAVQSWIQVFTRSGAEQPLLRRALDLKQSLESTLQKHKELHIDYKGRAPPEEEDDEDFEEVPEKEGYEPCIPEHLRMEYGLDPSPSTSAAAVPKRPVAPTPPPFYSSSSSSALSRRMRRLIEEEQDPTSAAATLSHLKKQISVLSECSSSQSSSAHKPVDAPVVPFGLDLYYWGKEQPNAGKIIKATSQHQFWVPTEVEEEVENHELLAESKSRYISFPGTFTPVSHFCKAPLANGTLCQRQDRHKCPFHGPIVPRDQDGRPCLNEDRVREERRKREQQPDWRDVELMRDIEAATGEDLGSERAFGKKGKRKKKKKKYPNLSDLKQSSNTSRSRLERKVFNKSSMRRAADVMKQSDRRKHDKFSNQFNYALN
uniref:UV-stimulated scaffold protein A n=1 Tax=Gouania willdenowi TaxID=441366 RepID=A0A8C5GPF7_GOUWI